MYLLPSNYSSSTWRSWQALPLTYVALSAWKHNKFWLNWLPARKPELPDGHVVNNHKIVTPMMATIAHDAYTNTSYLADPIDCAKSCAKEWGWRCCHDSPEGRTPLDKIACCAKRV